MKRDINLKTLSWEHHDGLVLIFRIERGLKNHSDPELIRSYLLHSWETALTHHFWQEEETLPGILNQNREGKILLKKMREDHQEIEKLIISIQTNSSDSRNELDEFGKELSRHIRFEERELFPFIERNADKHSMEKIGTFLKDQHRAGNEIWEPAFWR